MNPEVKAQWLAALRSGEYEQGMSALREENSDGTSSFCCLGVLCDLAVKNGVIPEPELASPGGYRYRYGGTETTVLPYEVQVWAGVEAHGERPGSEKLDDLDYDSRFLTELNDRGLPFAEIADIIEAEF